MFSYGVTQYSENSAWKIGFNLEVRQKWVNDYRKIWKAVEEQLFVTYASECVKEGCYLHRKVKVWKDKIRTNFHGKEILHNQYCEPTAALKVALVYKQGSNYCPQVHIKEGKIKPIENSRLLSDSKDDYKWL